MPHCWKHFLLPTPLKRMPSKRHQVWLELRSKMKNKQPKANATQQRVKKSGFVSHELIVQRLALYSLTTSKPSDLCNPEYE